MGRFIARGLIRWSGDVIFGIELEEEGFPELDQLHGFVSPAILVCEYSY
jgi:hypothetical protein